MKKFSIFSGIALLVSLYCGCFNSQNPTDTTEVSSVKEWSTLSADLERSTYLIGFRKSDGEVLVLGSGFAVSPHAIVTNAHVALAAPEQLNYYSSYFEGELSLVACRAGSNLDSTNVINLDQFIVHQGYTGLLAPDFALFKTVAFIKDTIVRASDSVLRALSTGDEIATLGFPGEISFNLGRNFPEPVFKNGTISALHTFSGMGDSTNATTYVLQHNFNLTGGTSGSPIINRDGVVIAINNSGFSGLSIGFGIRIDLLNYCLRQTSFSSIYDISHNSFDYWSAGATLASGISKVRIGNRLARVDSVFGTHREVIVDSALVGLYRYTDGYSYILEFLCFDSIVERIIITNTPGQTRLNRYREINRDVSIGVTRNSLELAYGTADFKDTINGLVCYNYPHNGMSFGFKEPIADFCSAILLYPSGWPIPYHELIDTSTIPSVNVLLSKHRNARSFKDVPPFPGSN